MNGANAVPCVRTMKTARRIRIVRIGPSHHFLRTLINDHNSPKIENRPVYFLIVFAALDFFLELLTDSSFM